MSKADTPGFAPLSEASLREMRDHFAAHDEDDDRGECCSYSAWDVQSLLANLSALQSTLDRLSEPGEGCRGCGGIIGPYCVECGEAAAQQQAGSPKKKSEE